MKVAHYDRDGGEVRRNGLASSIKNGEKLPLASTSHSPWQTMLDRGPVAFFENLDIFCAENQLQQNVLWYLWTYSTTYCPVNPEAP